jgi:hypothetical protein
MSDIAKPKTLDDATVLLSSVARINAAIAKIEARRRAARGKVDAAADRLLMPLVTERDALTKAIEPWWKKAAASLLKGKRKSIEIGGCVIGSRTASERLEFSHGDDAAALTAVMGSDLKAKATVVVRVLDKVGIKTLLGGKTAAATALRALGFKIGGGEEVFFIKPADNPEAKVSAQ